MFHRVFGRKLGRTSNERKALFRSLANQLIINEKIVTTEAKAKAVRPMVEKLVTKAKTNSIHMRRLLLKELVSETSVSKMLELIGPKFKERPGGYTRIVKINSRAGDRAPMVSLAFVEAPSQVEAPKKVKSTKEEIVATQETKEEPKKETKKRAPRVAKEKKEEEVK